jgi:hypothetical protein
MGEAFLESQAGLAEYASPLSVNSSSSTMASSYANQHLFHTTLIRILSPIH